MKLKLKNLKIIAQVLSNSFWGGDKRHETLGSETKESVLFTEVSGARLLAFCSTSPSPTSHRMI